MNRRIVHSVVLVVALICISSSSYCQQSPITAFDLFFNTYEAYDQDIESLFTKTGRISTIYYDATGQPAIQSFTPSEYKVQLASIAEVYQIERTPKVLILREYGAIARIYSTVRIVLTDRSTSDVLVNNTIQSVQLIKTKGQWKINHISIQSEHPSYPIDSKLLPNEMAVGSKVNNQSRVIEKHSPAIPDFSTEYDPNKVYKVNEVDELPFYPDDIQLFLNLKKTYGVVDQPTVGYTPFIVTIMEDGLAELTYTHDLSGFQIAQAESFVRSMMIWYPAVKYAASVKCEIVFYIRE